MEYHFCSANILQNLSFLIYVEDESRPVTVYSSSTGGTRKVKFIGFVWVHPLISTPFKFLWIIFCLVFYCRKTCLHNLVLNGENDILMNFSFKRYSITPIIFQKSTIFELISCHKFWKSWFIKFFPLGFYKAHFSNQHFFFNVLEIITGMVFL